MLPADLSLLFLSVRFGTLDSYGVLSERGFEEKERHSHGAYLRWKIIPWLSGLYKIISKTVALVLLGSLILT